MITGGSHGFPNSPKETRRVGYGIGDQVKNGEGGGGTTARGMVETAEIEAEAEKGGGRRILHPPILGVEVRSDCKWSTGDDPDSGGDEQVTREEEVEPSDLGRGATNLETGVLRNRESSGAL